MADPLSIGMATMGGLSMMGTGLQVAGQLGQADTYSRLADIDTQAVNEQGDLAKQLGFEQAKEIRRQGTQLLHEQTATVASSGLVANTGSALLVANETARNIELDALTSEYEGMREKKLTDRQAALIQYDKRLTKRNASMQAFGTILGGITQAGSSAVGMMGRGGT
ncbi:MAG: hypothetical protein JFAIHJKO_02768 [Pyrinomonadaceae bacterium]|nr:hypothetical protein [Pyrinomonadaceae bacterium]